MSKRNGLRLDFYDFQSLFSRISHGFCCTAVRAVFIIYCNQNVALIYHVCIPLAESGYSGFLRADDMNKICFRLNILTARFVSVMVGKGQGDLKKYFWIISFSLQDSLGGPCIYANCITTNKMDSSFCKHLVDCPI